MRNACPARIVCLSGLSKLLRQPFKTNADEREAAGHGIPPWLTVVAIIMLLSSQSGCNSGSSGGGDTAGNSSAANANAAWFWLQSLDAIHGHETVRLSYDSECPLPAEIVLDRPGDTYLVGEVTASTGFLVWEVPPVEPGAYEIIVHDARGNELLRRAVSLCPPIANLPDFPNEELVWLSITTPEWGETLYADRAPVRISWEVRFGSVRALDLLIRHDGRAYPIVENLPPETGSYVFNIPDDLYGRSYLELWSTDYKQRLCFRFVEIIRVGQTTGLPKITITSPGDGQEFEPGDVIDVAWENAGMVPPRITIRLTRFDFQVMLAPSVPTNSLSFSAQLPPKEDIPEPGYYFLEIAGVDEPLHLASIIVKLLYPPEPVVEPSSQIHLDNPPPDDVLSLQPDQLVRVSWRVSGDPLENFSLFLRTGVGNTGILLASVHAAGRSEGTFDWRVPYVEEGLWSIYTDSPGHFFRLSTIIIRQRRQSGMASILNPQPGAVLHHGECTKLSIDSRASFAWRLTLEDEYLSEVALLSEGPGRDSAWWLIPSEVPIGNYHLTLWLAGGIADSIPITVASQQAVDWEGLQRRLEDHLHRDMNISFNTTQFSDMRWEPRYKDGKWAALISTRLSMQSIPAEACLPSPYRLLSIKYDWDLQVADKDFHREKHAVVTSETEIDTSWDVTGIPLGRVTVSLRSEVRYAIEVDGARIQRTFAREVSREFELTVAARPPLPSEDVDRDGLHDILEDELALKFAPVVYLHSDEDCFPSAVTTYLQWVSMRFHHAGCSDCEILNRFDLCAEVASGNLNVINQQKHRGKKGLGICAHTGNARSSGGGSRTGFFFEIVEGGLKGFVRSGIPYESRSKWKCYAHVRRSRVAMHIDITYWFFYAYNGTIEELLRIDVPSAHEGDWERITVRVAPDHETIQAIFFSAHKDEGRWFGPDEDENFEIDPATGRPVVYVAWRSHACYPKPGTYRRPLPIPITISDRTDRGYRHDFVNGIQRIGSFEHPLSGQEWIRFSGRWGEIGEEWLLFEGLENTTGPFGPAYRDIWEVEEPND